MTALICNFWPFATEVVCVHCLGVWAGETPVGLAHKECVK